MVAGVLIFFAVLVVLSCALHLRRLGRQVTRHGVRPVAGSGSDGVHPGHHSEFDGDGGDGGGGGGGGGD